MSDSKPDLYTGLDQLIAKPTRPEEPAPEAPQPPASALTTDGPSSEQRKQLRNGKKTDDEEGTRFVRELDPDPPDVLYLYRKQTLEFGPKDLEAVEHVQNAMSETHKREVTKTELVRAAVEFLVKDYNAHREQSFIVRKFVRRR